jgi:eukaryotic-like serine/threonine-protein kinase
MPSIFEGNMTELRERLQTALGAAYQIQKELGGGGMSRVYVAEETRLKRRVVVKVLPPELGAAINVDRFHREVELSASLQHPHIVPLLAAGGVDDVLYYTMPLIEGESLRARLARERELPVPEVVRILRDVVDALAYAHTRGVIHRDIKPDNVLISGNHALVADFGVAKAVRQAQGASGLTSIGMALGTPAYMAPEQAAGDPNVDHRADLYAVGAMAYEMLAGRPPFSGMSPHQMLAAHVTEPVTPITDHRPSLPGPLAALVMRCLEKNPADRPQSAIELHQLLDGLLTPTGGMTPASGIGTAANVLRRPRNRRLAIATGAVLLLAAAWVALRPRTASALDPNVVAIAPFDVLDPELALWREGLVDVLSRSLDGAGPLRTVSPTMVVRRWSGRADPAAARALGQVTGAGLALFGTLIGSGEDSVRLSASVLEVSTGTVIGEIQLRGASSRMDRLADSLAIAVLRELGRSRAIGSVRSTSLGSASLPALKAFLQGEQFLRRSVWDSALAYYERAIELDSAFTLAYSHAGQAAGWQHSGGDRQSTEYKLKAGRMNHGLAPRESLMVHAESLTAVVFSGPQQLAGAWYGHGRRLLATLGEAVARYPNDPEPWFLLGDVRYHSSGPGLSTRREALQAFDRAISLDSAFTPAYIHAIDLALELDGQVASQRYAKAFLTFDPAGNYAASTKLTVALLGPGVGSREARALIDSASVAVLNVVLTSMIRWADTAETAVTLARRLRDLRVRPGASAADSLQGTTALAVALAYRGHLAAAESLGGRTLLAPLYAELALLGAIPTDTAGTVFREWFASQTNRGATWTAMPWLAARRDTVTLRNYRRTIEEVRGHLPPNVPPIAKELLGYVTLAADAYLALARGDSADALRRFTALPDSACYASCPLDTIVEAQLLAAAGRDREAAAVLDRERRSIGAPFPSETLRALERGRIHERLGNREMAIEAYARVASVWVHGDPEVRPFVDEAKAALARLGGERPR